jgi:hypothetical protein
VSLKDDKEDEVIKVRLHMDEEGVPSLAIFIGIKEIMQALGIGLSSSSVGGKPGSPFGPMLRAVLDELKARAMGTKKRRTRRSS